jgi:hypothetical protein
LEPIQEGARHRISGDGPYKGGTKGGAGSNCEVSSPQTSQLRQTANHTTKWVVRSLGGLNRPPLQFLLYGTKLWLGSLIFALSPAPSAVRALRRATLLPHPCYYHADPCGCSGARRKCARRHVTAGGFGSEGVVHLWQVFDRVPNAALQWRILTAEP